MVKSKVQRPCHCSLVPSLIPISWIRKSWGRPGNEAAAIAHLHFHFHFYFRFHFHRSWFYHCPSAYYAKRISSLSLMVGHFFQNLRCTIFIRILNENVSISNEHHTSGVFHSRLDLSLKIFNRDPHWFCAVHAFRNFVPRLRSISPANYSAPILENKLCKSSTNPYYSYFVTVISCTIEPAADRSMEYSGRKAEFSTIPIHACI